MSLFDIEKEVVKEYALGGSVGCLDEMKILHNRYVREHSWFNCRVQEDDRRVFIEFSNANGNTNFEVDKNIRSVNTWAEPFDWVEFSNVSLANIVLRSDVAWADEYLLATFWGEPATTNMDDFVGNNVRILQEYYVPNRSRHNLPESAVEDDEFDTTDVRTYTNRPGPVPWARGSIAVLYEDWDVCDKIIGHSECNLSGQMGESPPYPKNPTEVLS